MDSVRGKLFVATPGLTNPNFRMSVLLMIAHNRRGALGVMLNRPSDLPVRRASSDWHDFSADPKVVFVGGPVSQSSLICLASTAGASGGRSWRAVTGRIGTVDLDQVSQSAGGLAELRIFAGCAAWAPGQLEAEIAEDSWLVLRLAPSDPFTAYPRDLWWQVFARQENPNLRQLRLYPRNPSNN